MKIDLKKFNAIPSDTKFVEIQYEHFKAMVDGIEILINLVDQFYNLKTKQHKLLDKGLDKAIKNWDKATNWNDNKIDFNEAINFIKDNIKQ